MDPNNLNLIKAKVLNEITKTNIREEIMKVISVIEESRAPSTLNLNESVLEKSGRNIKSSIRYDKLSKQDLTELFRKINNVSKSGDNYLEQLEEYVESLIVKQESAED